MPLKARLERDEVGPLCWDYYLLVHENFDPEVRIDVARIEKGEMRLVDYEVSRRGDDRILSAFFYANVLGHELDQWLHFDLRSGRQVVGYVNPMQASGQNPQKDRVDTPDEKKVVADKLRGLIDKWKREKDDGK